MKFLSFSIRDNVASTFSVPYMFRSEAEAKRAFLRVLSSNEALPPALEIVRDSPRDFSLYQIGTYDDEVGLLTAVEHNLVFHFSDLPKSEVSDQCST